MPMPKKQDEVFGDDVDSFAKEMESPNNLMADDLFREPKARPMPRPRPTTTSSPIQRIPAFVSLTKYKELRLALRDMKNISLDMHKTLENLKANRDGGTELLDRTVNNLETLDNNIDKIKGVLRV